MVKMCLARNERKGKFQASYAQAHGPPFLGSYPHTQIAAGLMQARHFPAIFSRIFLVSVAKRKKLFRATLIFKLCNY